MSIFKKVALMGSLSLACIVLLNPTSAKADVIKTVVGSVYNGYSFIYNLYTVDDTRFQKIYDRIPDTVTMDIPISDGFNIAINAADLVPFPFGRMTKTIKGYISDNVKPGSDLGTVLSNQFINIINFPTNKKETKLAVAALSPGSTEIIYTVGNTMKKQIVGFVGDVTDTIGKNLGLTPEETDIFFSAVYFRMTKFNVTKFEFVSGTFNKITVTLEKNKAYPNDPILKQTLPGVKKAILDYLNMLFTKDVPYIDGTTARNAGNISPYVLKIYGDGFTPTNNAVKLTPAGSSELNVPSTSMLATPQSFAGKILSAFESIWTIFKMILPFAQGQTLTRSGNSYFFYDIPYDDVSGKSITLNIPTSTPPGIYSVAVGSFNTDWLATSLKFTVSNSGVTVSGNLDAGNIGVYIDGYSVPAIAKYVCPADTISNRIKYNFVLNPNNTCTEYATPYSGGNALVTVTFGNSSSLPSGMPAIPATLTYTCPTVPVMYTTLTGKGGIFSLTGSTSGKVCVFHSYNIVSVDPVTSTTTSTTTPTASSTIPTEGTIASSTTTTGTYQVIRDAILTYKCATGSILSGTSCTRTGPVACTTSVNLMPGQTSNCYAGPTNIPATAVYTCMPGYTLSGAKCISNPGTTFCNSSGFVNTMTNGSTGCVINSCYSPYVVKYDSSIRTYSCVNGTTITTPTTIATTTPSVVIPPVATSTIVAPPVVVTPPTVITPPAQQVTVAATVTYTCPSGATLNVTDCNTPDTVGIPATAKYTKSASGLFVYVYSCGTGYVLKGQRCYSAAGKVAPATPKYSCSTGFTLNSATKMCVK